MSKLITIFAWVMIAVGVLSFVWAAVNWLAMESVPADSLTHSPLRQACWDWIVSCWSYGWAFVWGGVVLLVLGRLVDTH